MIRVVSALALLAVTACGDDDEPQDDNDERDASAMDGGRSDAGDAATDARAQPDARVSPDAAVVDSGAPLDAGAMDASMDSGAQIVDAGSDAGDAAADASVVDSGPPLAAWYKFDENSGTSTVDSTSSFAAGTLLNGAGWVAGKTGSAVDLSGGPGDEEHDYVSLPATLIDGCNEITIALWMKLGSLPPWARILDVDGVDGFVFFTPTQIVEGTPRLLFNVYYPAGAGADDQGVSAAYPANTTLVNVWHHVAFTQANGTGRLYFDGVEIGSSPMMIKPSDPAYTGANAHAWLGRSRFDVDGYLDATLDDLRVACTAYTPQQIAALAQ